MAPLAARRLAEMVDLGKRVVAIELVIAARVIDLRKAGRLGIGARHAYQTVRDVLPAQRIGDSIPSNLASVVELIRERTVARATRARTAG